MGYELGFKEIGSANADANACRYSNSSDWAQTGIIVHLFFNADRT